MSAQRIIRKAEVIPPKLTFSDFVLFGDIDFCGTRFVFCLIKGRALCFDFKGRSCAELVARSHFFFLARLFPAADCPTCLSASLSLCDEPTIAIYKKNER